MATYVPAKNATAFIVYVALRSQATSTTFQANPTIAAGDFKVSIDGGALANLTTLPTVTPAAGKMVKISLSAAEMTGDNITVVCSDVAGAEWMDAVLNLQTTARQIDDLATPTNITAGTITTVTNLTNAPTAGDFTATMKTSATTAATAATPTAAAVTGAVGSVTGAVGSVTGNVGGNVVGSVASVTAAVTVSGDLSATMKTSVTTAATAATPVAASVTGAVGSVTGNVGGNVTGTVGSVVGAVGSVTGAVGSVTAAVSVTGDLTATMKTSVKTQVTDALNVDTYAESAAVPAATTTLVAKIGWLATLARNKITQTATTQLVRNDADAATIGTATVSDDTVTAIRGKFA